MGNEKEVIVKSCLECESWKGNYCEKGLKACVETKDKNPDDQKDKVNIIGVFYIGAAIFILALWTMLPIIALLKTNPDTYIDYSKRVIYSYQLYSMMAVANLYGLIGMPFLIGLVLNIVEKKTDRQAFQLQTMILPISFMFMGILDALLLLKIAIRFKELTESFPYEMLLHSTIILVLLWVIYKIIAGIQKIKNIKKEG